MQIKTISEDLLRYCFYCKHQRRSCVIIYFFKNQKIFSRFLALLLIISVTSMGFPGTLLASDYSKSAETKTTTTPTTITNILKMMNNSSSTQSTEDPAVNAQAAKDDVIGNKVLVKQASNMPISDNKSTSSIPETNADPSSQPTTDNSSESSTDETRSNKDSLKSDKGDKIDESNTNDNSNSNELSDDNTNKNETTDSENDETYPIKIKNKEGKYNIGFTKQSGKSLLKFTHGKASLAMNPLDSAKVTGKVKKNTILYKSIYSDIDLHYTIDDYRLKEDIIINKLSDQSDFSFQLNIKNADFQMEDDGTISFVEPGTTTQLFYMAKPYALDKDGNLCDSIDMQLSKKGLLKLSIDPEWLQQAAYPVTIDPTIYLAGSEVYQASAGFSSNQGQNNWSYEEQISDNTFNPLTWDNTQRLWLGTSPNTQVGSNWQQPTSNNAVRTWKVPHSGTITISGSCQSATGTGDGVNIKILKNANQVWPSSGWQEVAPNVPTGVDINKSMTVNAGDSIRFVVNQKTDPSGDKTTWDPVISYDNNLAGSEVDYQASTNFSSTQGKNNWNYEEQKISDSSIKQLTWDNSQGLWLGSSTPPNTKVEIEKDTQLPSSDYNAVRTWKAPHPGTISISGVCKSATGTGDGVNIKILKNTDQVWPSSGWQEVAADDTTGVSINQSITVNAGDSIRFVVNQKTDPSGDKTTWDPAISYDNNNLPSTTTFTRSSTAYQNGTQKGTQVEPNTPLYETGKFGQALRIEKGTKNLLSANQSSAETDLADWSKAFGNISKVSGGWNGDYCVQCDLAANDWVGFDDPPVQTDTTKDRTYTFSIYAKGTVGKQIKLCYMNGTYTYSSASFTLADTWQRFTYTFTVGVGTTVNNNFRIFIQDSAKAAQKFWVDGCQLEENMYATPWMIGGTDRAAETLTIPTAGVINANQGSIEVRAYIDPKSTDPEGAHSASNPNPSTIFSVADVDKDSPTLVKNQITIQRQRKASSNYWYVYFSNANGSTSSVSLGSITTAGWYSFGATWKAGGYGYGYKNGVNMGSVSASYLPETISTPVAYIGSYVNGTGQFDQLIDDLRISNRQRTTAEVLAGYQSTQPMAIDADSTCVMNFDNSLQINGPTQSSPEAVKFTRSSVAYKLDGTPVSANTSRYETGQYGTAVMIEEGTTNVLTANQSSAETDLVGWSTQNATISRVTGGWIGANSVKCDLTASGWDSWVGFTGLQLEPDMYTFSVYAKGTSGKKIDLFFQKDGSGATGGSYTLSSTWQRYSFPCNVGQAGTYSVYVANDSSTSAQTMYLDGCQMEKNVPGITNVTAYPTTWMLGGTARSAETMTIPTAGVLSAGKGSIEVSAYIDPDVFSVHRNNQNATTLFDVADIQATPYLKRNQISISRQGSTNWYVYFSNASGTVSSINLGSITTAGWNKFGVTWQAGVGGYGYLNGVNKGNVPASSLPEIITTPVAYIGSWVDGTGQFNQLIDDIRISNRLRTETEILAAATSNKAFPLDADTTCKLNFDDVNSQPVASGSEGTGIKPFWNYTDTDLGGGWKSSVNTYNLNMVLNKTLFQIPGRGIPIGESITYNSQDSTTGPLGIGWHLGSDTSITEKSDGSVIYIGSDGSVNQFTPASDGKGGYVAPPGIYLKLEKDAT